MKLLLCAVLALVLQAPAALGQSLSEKIWGAVAFTLYGDSTPTALPESRTLTSFGAHDLYTAGSVFRSRYVSLLSNGATVSTRVQGISPYLLNTDQVNVYSTADQFVTASAQAFMQGLYPPLGQSYNGTYLDEPSSLANGSVVNFPLNGYQYPDIYTAGFTDPSSVAVAGQAACFMYQVSQWQYQASPEFQQIAEETAAFYAYLYDVALSGVYDRADASYANAYYISEYLEYEYLHNSTLQDILSLEGLNRAKSIADQYVFATNGNLSASGLQQNDRIRAVAGRTLAELVLEAFESNIQTQGSQAKMSLVFGSYEPAVALAALTQLTKMYDNFYGRPVQGASLVFELYSFEDGSSAYPSTSDLNVRFLLRNSTNSSSGFTYYPLFGHGPSQISIPFTEFQSEIAQIAMPSTEEWCTTCNTSTVFCSGLVTDSQESATPRKGLSAASAGVIGAFVTLIALALIAALGFLLCGIRIHRKRRSELGGFKGNSKLASDTDVAFKGPSGGAIKTTEAQTEENSNAGAAVRGHERVGSWEMGQQKKEIESADGSKTGPNFEHEEEDWQISPFADPVKVHESV